MKTSIKTVAGKKILVVDTGIPVAAYREGITKLNVVVEEKTEAEFELKIDKDAAAGTISGFCMVADGVENENFAVTVPLTAKATVEDVKKKYGAALVKANVGLAKLLESMTKEAAAIDGIFNGLEM